MWFHPVYFAYNIYFQARSQILTRFLIKSHRQRQSFTLLTTYHWSTYLIWINVFTQRHISMRLSSGKSAIISDLPIPDFFILLDRFKYLSTKLKPFCKRHPGFLCLLFFGALHSPAQGYLFHYTKSICFPREHSLNFAYLELWTNSGPDKTVYNSCL